MNVLPHPTKAQFCNGLSRKKAVHNLNRICSITKVDRTLIFPSFFFLTAKITMTEVNDQNVKIFVQNGINCSYHLVGVKLKHNGHNEEKQGCKF